MKEKVIKKFIKVHEPPIPRIFTMTHRLEKIIEMAEKDMQTGKNMSPAFHSMQAMDKYLDSL